MNKQQWERLERTVRQENDKLEAGLIVDSPWMPGYCGITNLDFYCQPDTWLAAYDKIKTDFPSAIFLPDHWCEFGMATEPSGFGCLFDLYPDNLPTVHHIIEDIDDTDAINALKVPNPKKHGLMPILLNLQGYLQPKLQERGEDFYIVSSRGPLTIASHLMELTELLVGIKSEGDEVHKILKVTTQLCKDWLEAQLDTVKNAKGILLLDDVTGFLNEEDYLEFAHPYLKDIFQTFGSEIHLFHNDAVRDCSYPHLEDCGVDLFNFTHKVDIGQAKKMVGQKVCLLGNVPPMSLVRETPETVAQQTRDVIQTYVDANGGDYHGLLLSTGGGMPMGARKETTQALLDAVEAFNREK